MPPSLNFPQLDFVKPSSGFHPVTWERVTKPPLRHMSLRSCSRFERKLELLTMAAGAQLSHHQPPQLFFSLPSSSSCPSFVLFLHCSCNSLPKRIKNEVGEGNSPPPSCCYVVLCVACRHLLKETTWRATIGTHPSLLLLHSPSNNKDHARGGFTFSLSFQVLPMNN